MRFKPPSKPTGPWRSSCVPSSPTDSNAVLSRQVLFCGSPGGSGPFVHPPLDHPDPHRVLVTGTGLTHTGSMQSRDQMHAAQKEGRSSPSPITANDVSATPKTDSARMFELGVQGGKPRPGTRGTAAGMVLQRRRGHPPRTPRRAWRSRPLRSTAARSRRSSAVTSSTRPASRAGSVLPWGMNGRTTRRKRSITSTWLRRSCGRAPSDRR